MAPKTPLTHDGKTASGLMPVLLRSHAALDSPVSRLAPTPSGFLHLGNAVNFLVTWAIVRARGGVLHLRIDDMDGIRFREDVLEDIFYSLEWLGLDWDLGPSGPMDFFSRHSLQLRKEFYREQLTLLGEKSGKTFACGCSRKEIQKRSQSGLYPGTCRAAGKPFEAGTRAVRIKVDHDAMIRVNGICIDLARVFGDFILWRKDDQPAYQLASLLEDEAAGITLVVRGEDLLHSTAAQIYLARCFGFTAFPSACFVHHSLVMGKDGEKLSKSRGAYALKDLRETGQGPEMAVKAAASVLGISPDRVLTAADLKTMTGQVLDAVKAS